MKNGKFTQEERSYLLSLNEFFYAVQISHSARMASGNHRFACRVSE